MLEKVTPIIKSVADPTLFIQKLSLLFGFFLIGVMLIRVLLYPLGKYLLQGKTFILLWAKLGPLKMLLGGLTTLFLSLSYVKLPRYLLTYYLLLFLRILFFYFIVVWVSRLIDCIIILTHQRLEAKGKPIPVALFFFGRVFKGILTIIIIVAVLPTFFFGYGVLNTLVKYIGLSSISAGAIAGLAFQPVLSDILGGLFVISQDLFTEGDWIEANISRQLIVGRVVDINLRYTRLKRWTGSFLMVPNNAFLSAVVDNYGRAHYTSYSLTLTAMQKGKIALKKFLQGYENLIKASPHIEEEKCHVTVKNLAIDRMALELHIFFNKTDDKDKIVRIHTFWQDILALISKEKMHVNT